MLIASPILPIGDYAEAAFDNFFVKGLSSLFADTFDQDNHWEITTSGGDYNVSNLDGEYLLRQNTANQNIKSLAPLADIQLPYSVEVYARRPAEADADTRYGLLFDWTGTLQYYRFIVEPDTGIFQLQKYVSGFVTLGSGSLPAGFLSDGATLKVERDGDVIRAYINGTQVAVANDTTYTHGQVGLMLIASPILPIGDYAEAAFDNFFVKELP